jgi:predicted nicotinamide N-methyase
MGVWRGSKVARDEPAGRFMGRPPPNSHRHLRVAHGVQILKQQHPVIRSLRKAGPRPTLYGARVWQSTFMLMDHLVGHPLARDPRVMEIGCGWGLLGIFCAMRFAAEVLLTDADERVFPYAMIHARLNRVSVRTEHVGFERITDPGLREHDILLGADVCFWPELGTSLRRLITRALSLGAKKIMLADPGRASFMQLANYCQYHYAAKLIPCQVPTKTRSGGYILIVEQPAGG